MNKIGKSPFKRVTAVDVGTNSTLYLIADVDVNQVHPLERGIYANRLGAEMMSDRVIPRAILEHNRTIFTEIAAISRAHNCIAIRAVGTHALRLAENAGEFIQLAADCGISLRIVSPDEEIRLAWVGVFAHSPIGSPNALLDLGGGSTELSIGAGTEINWSQSIPIGAVGLARRVFHHDPPTNKEIRIMQRIVSDSFAGWRGRLDTGLPLTGAAGTVTALAAIELGLEQYRMGALEGMKLTNDQITKWRDRLTKMAFNQRRSVPGMPQGRVASIHAGAVILAAILDILKSPILIVSEKGVLFGVAHQMRAE